MIEIGFVPVENTEPDVKLVPVPNLIPKLLASEFVKTISGFPSLLKSFACTPRGLFPVPYMSGSR
ncbi:hypothetical protein D3C86_1058770 [compost metagenome]